MLKLRDREFAYQRVPQEKLSENRFAKIIEQNDRFLYSRLKKEYKACITGLQLMEWTECMEVFVRDLQTE